MHRVTRVFVFCLFIPVYILAASNSCSHSVSIRIIPVDHLELEGGNVDFTFYSDKNSSNQGHAEQIDNSCRLQWSIFSNERKITVQSDNSNSEFKLYVQAEQVEKGQSAGKIRLGNSPAAQDFIRGVGRSRGSCNLNYNAITRLKNQEKSEIHHITYTIVSE
ncbi:MAG: hypothetical protein U5R06_10355 [candidate division KSB1 bacterium]|nr:hypothetical protein [candidate division KSB1 bacterium]